MDRNTTRGIGGQHVIGSLSARRAWIEIPISRLLRSGTAVALRKESVDRNLLRHCRDSIFKRSLSARRAWIEISAHHTAGPQKSVALRKESVDRNGHGVFVSVFGLVALRKESVDRNTENAVLFLMTAGSLSARRAWIEIKKNPLRIKLLTVALRKESVDRNCDGRIDTGVTARVALRKESVDRNIGASYGRTAKIVSLSARRAWIEMLHCLPYGMHLFGRSPQGERG